MATLSETRTVGAIVILLEGLIGMTNDEALKENCKAAYSSLMGYMSEQDAARKEKLAAIENVKTEKTFDKAAYNAALIETLKEMAEIEVSIVNTQTNTGKPVTKLTFEVDGREQFLYDFKVWEAVKGARWVKGADFARALWVNKQGYLSLDAKRGKPIILAGKERVSEDIPF